MRRFLFQVNSFSKKTEVTFISKKFDLHIDSWSFDFWRGREHNSGNGKWSSVRIQIKNLMTYAKLKASNFCHKRRIYILAPEYSFKNCVFSYSFSNGVVFANRPLYDWYVLIWKALFNDCFYMYSHMIRSHCFPADQICFLLTEKPIPQNIISS